MFRLGYNRTCVQLVQQAARESYSSTQLFFKLTDDKRKVTFFFLQQREFVQFCKTLCSMFHGVPGENELFQAIAVVTSLVLQIGEARNKGAKPKESDQTTMVSASARESMLEAEIDWTVSFEQILASLLTEQVLVNFLETPVDLSGKIASAKEKQYQQRSGLLMVQHSFS